MTNSNVIFFTEFPTSGLGLPNIYQNLGDLSINGECCGRGNSQESPRKGYTNSPANPILTNFTYSESLSILPPSES